jgi:LuxR family maltose regulon positive regulatory protein
LRQDHEGITTLCRIAVAKALQVPFFAKTTVPHLSGIHPRERLFSLLDGARERRAIWVYGPPGAGKTTLVASYLKARQLHPLWDRLDEGDTDLPTFFHYLGMAAQQAAPRNKTPLPALTPEYRHGLPAFTRRYFRDLFERLKLPFAVVFDDYHEVSPASPLNDLLQYGLEEIPETGNVIVVSRTEPPEQLARLRANGLLHVIAPDALGLTVEEIKGIAQSRGTAELSDEDIGGLADRTQGWTAGLVLMLESQTSGARHDKALCQTEPQLVFGYFAGEIFRRMEQDEQDVLLACAFLPTTSARMAEELTGQRRAGETLEALYLRNYFVSRDAQAEPAYRYHPLFREFLLARAHKTWDEERLAAVRRRGAELLEAAGHAEMAVELFRAAAGWRSIVSIILKWAPSLLEQGRHMTIDMWLDELPQDLLADNPWLCYWRAAARLPLQPGQSQPWFEQAFALFRAGRDRVGLFLSWAGTVQAIRFNLNADYRRLDGWIATLDELLTEDPTFPSEEIEYDVAHGMYGALHYRMPWHAGFDAWKQRALALARSGPRSGTRVLTVYMATIFELHTGNLAQARILLDSAPPPGSSHLPPLAQNLAYLAVAYYQRTIGMTNACLETVAAALAASRSRGIHVWDFFMWGLAAQAAMAIGDLAGAEQWLNEIATSTNVAVRGRSSEYHRFAASLALLRGDIPTARRHAETSLELSAGLLFEDAWSHSLLCHVLQQIGELVEARKHQAAALAIGHLTKSHSQIYWSALQEADLAFDSRDEAGGLAALRNAMTLGREQGYMRLATFTFYPSGLSRLCARALEAGIETEYVRATIRCRELVPASADVENWPWPLKIFTMGRFALLKDDEPVEFAHKAPKKPLTLLKAIIAFGGKSIPETQLTEALWPDQEGDAAHQAFASALHRLRKLLGVDDALVLDEGRLTLNPRYCWVDAWAFQRLLGQPEEAAHSDEADQQPRLAEQALRLYRGGFLPADTEEPWAASLRERLRSLFMRRVLTVARQLQESGNTDRAITYYARGVEVDPLAEAFYQGLMRCYLDRGRVAEGLAAYRQLRQTLSVTLGVMPSAGSEALHQSLLGQSVAS